ncbi:MAG TPA: heparinase II/III family protein [Stackebrandtia sp.]|uniref:heparinase II/III domain-containing protein n=1 Tax=Stackebrandtia sp. TaxID=2023065 RepID=UPI002D2AB284|nr:heparinase II/III family protein [Stackebrandtia sp.]HZE37614.1 heparinase II/III family protein [Stackebrandtia sp.]
MYRYSEIIAAAQQAPAARSAVDRAALASVFGRADLAGLVAELRADAASAEPLPDLPYRLFRTYVHDGDRYGFEGRYFARRRRLNSTAVVALAEGGEENFARLSDVLWAICDEYSWAVPAHHRFNTTLDLGYHRCIDLFAAETAHALSEIVAAAGDDLEEPVRRRVIDNVRHRVLDAFADEPRARWWETGTNNWAAVCAGSIGMAALAIEDDPLRLAAILHRVQDTMAAFLSGFTADGGCPEGMGYWVYGYGYFAYYAEALRERTGMDLLAGTEKVAAFPAAVDFGDGRCVSFSDDPGGAVPPTGLMSRVRDRLGVRLPQITRLSSFDDDHCYRWAHLTRTLLWTDPAVIGGAVPRGTTWLPDLAWVIDRGDVGSAAVMFAAKGGHNDEPHNHLDLGSFILAVDGVQVLADLGAGVYDADYFGPNRYRALHNSAAGHSVPVVDGVEQRVGADAAATVEEFRSDDSGIHLALDASAAYGGLEVRRGFDYDRRGRLEVTDRFGRRGSPLEELFMCRVPPRVADGAVEWRTGAAVVRLELGGDWDVSVETIDTFDHRAKPETVYRLRLKGTTAAERAFAFEVSSGQ